MCVIEIIVTIKGPTVYIKVFFCIFVPCLCIKVVLKQWKIKLFLCSIYLRTRNIIESSTVFFWGVCFFTIAFIYPSIHPFSLTASPALLLGGAGANPSYPSWERRRGDTPGQVARLGQGHVEKTNNHSHSHSHLWPVSNFHMHVFLTVGGSRWTRREAAKTRGERGNSTQTWGWHSQPSPSLWGDSAGHFHLYALLVTSKKKQNKQTPKCTSCRQASKPQMNREQRRLITWVHQVSLILSNSWQQLPGI